MKERKPISSEIQRLLLVQCGYKCSVPRCDTTDSLEFHHINKKPNDNRKENVIILCAVHHHQADIGRISAKDCEFIKQTLPKIEKTTKKWDPIPKIKFSLAQRLLRTLIFPQVGWEAYNDSPYQLKVRIEVNPILGGKELHPLSDDSINGTKPFDVAPYDWLFGNGCFSLPQECAASEKELILEIRAFVLDVNDKEKREYEVSPSRWKYVREMNSWSYYPQEPNVLKN
jgi:hypothetical protein